MFTQWSALTFPAGFFFRSYEFQFIIEITFHTFTAVLLWIAQSIPAK